MTLLLKSPERRPSVGEKFSRAVGAGLQGINQIQQKQAITQTLGPEAENLPLEFQKMAYESQLKRSEQADKLKSGKSQIRDIAKSRGLSDKEAEQAADIWASDVKTYEQSTRAPKEKPPSLTEKPVPSKISAKMNQILKDNPKASADELRLKMDEAGIPPVYSGPYTENRRRTEEATAKASEARRAALRQETKDIRSQLANKALIAEQSIRNKEQLLDLIKKGNLDDPTYAALAEALPLNLGKRMLSPDTTEYKSGIVEEYGDLKNIFPGAVRVKEIDILQEKLADIYLTDEQKEAILKSRIKAERAHMIRAEVAAELEDEDIGVLQFQKELEKRAAPKLNALFNEILDEQKFITQAADNRRKSGIQLDSNDPSDVSIAQQIFQEAGGDRKKARQIAEKKGYKL